MGHVSPLSEKQRRERRPTRSESSAIVIVYGPPGVGKTTVAHRVRERLTEAGLSFEIVGSDAFARRTYERIYDRVRSSSADWILDGTFHERKWFDRFRRFDERGVHVIYREFDAPDADLTIDTEDVPIEDTVKRVANAIARWHDERSTSTDR